MHTIMTTEVSSILRLAILAFAFFTGSLCDSARAERGYVVVQVEDAQGHPVRHLEIGVKGYGSSQLTGDDGKAKLRVGSAIRENDHLTLIILHSPPGRDFVMVSPWSNQERVPPFEDKPDNYIPVVVVQRGDRAALENNIGLASLTEQITKTIATKMSGQPSASEQGESALNTVARIYGQDPDELDRRIRAWGERTEDPYQLGLAKLYERKFADATKELGNSLKIRKDDLQKAHVDVARATRAVESAAFFLGISLYEEGKYKKASDSYLEALKVAPDDPVIMNNAAVTFQQLAEYVRAEAFYRQLLSTNSIDELTHAIVLNNLGSLMEEEGRYDQAQKLFDDAVAAFIRAPGALPAALATAYANQGSLSVLMGRFANAQEPEQKAIIIDEGLFGPDNPAVARDLNNLAELDAIRLKFAEAEKKYRSAIAIDEKAFNPDHPILIIPHVNLGELLAWTGRLKEAQDEVERALKIAQISFEPDHPAVNLCTAKIANLFRDRGMYSAAFVLYASVLQADERYPELKHRLAVDLNGQSILLIAGQAYPQAVVNLRRALTLNEQMFGPDDLTVGETLSGLGLALLGEGKLDEAETDLSRASKIEESILGPAHPNMAAVLNNLGLVEKHKANYTQAESTLRRAVEIDDKVTGFRSVQFVALLDNLSSVLFLEGKFADAANSERRAVNISTTILGPDYPGTKALQDHLDRAVAKQKCINCK